MQKISQFISLFASSLFLASCAHSPQIFNKTSTTQPALNVHIQNGKIAAPSGTPQTYQPINFSIANGECQEINISLVNNEAFPLRACYRKNILFLDAKKFGEGKSTRFYYSPLWQQGFTYPNITTNGPAHLMNVDIRLKLNF